MAKETFNVFDAMDPLDLAIMVDPAYDHTVDELDRYVEAAATGGSAVLSEAYDNGIGNNQFEAEDELGVGYDDDDSIDMPGDFASEDAEDYSTAEMELLAGDFGHPVDSIDGLEFDM